MNTRSSLSFGNPDEVSAYMAANKVINAADIDNAVYHGCAALSHSQIKNMSKSASKYKLALEKKGKQTPAMALGTAVHMAILEPELFDTVYCESPKFDRRTTKGKEDAAAWEAANTGRIPLAGDDLDMISRVSSKALVDPFFSKFLKPGLKEKSFFITDPDTGMQLRCRPDNYIPEQRVIVDVKTTDCAAPFAFNTDITKYGYLTQAAFYSDVVAQATGEIVEAFVIIAIEKSDDNDMVAYYFDDEEMKLGRVMYRRWLNKIAWCQKEDIWPGYDLGFVKYNAPMWLKEEVLNAK